MKVVSFSLGCKVNQYESDAFLAKLEKNGFEVSQKLEYADFYILNTCAVTAEAERKSRQAVTRFLTFNKDAKVFVCGCGSEKNVEPYLNREQVVYVGGTANKMALCDAIIELANSEKQNVISKDRSNAFDETVSEDVCLSTFGKHNTIERNKKFIKNNCLSTVGKDNVIEQDKTFEEMGNSFSPRTRHYIKVQDGCNNFCSYCIIPYLRGRCRSREVLNVVSEVEFAKTHTKEIVLTGINLSAYGKDIGSSLPKLLESLKDVDVRLRLGSLEVGIIDRELLDATKSLKDFCDHFHLSLQSGDDSVLKAMNRHYDCEQFKNAVNLIREYYPKSAITTDIIVGFPTETTEAFENSKNFAREVGFSDIHIFSFSPREGTVASKMQQLEKSVVDSRHKELEEVKIELRDAYNSKFLNTPQDVLFEKKQNGFFVGHTKNYITVYSPNGKRGEISSVVCTELYKDGIK